MSRPGSRLYISFDLSYSDNSLKKPAQNAQNDGPRTQNPDEIDWGRFDAMTEAQRHQAALNDPDAQSLTEQDLSRRKRTPQAKIIRRALGLSQEDFASRYHIPLGTLRERRALILWLSPASPKPCAKLSSRRGSGMRER
jgi:putative transcriptional regulator